MKITIGGHTYANKIARKYAVRSILSVIDIGTDISFVISILSEKCRCTYPFRGLDLGVALLVVSMLTFLIECVIIYDIFADGSMTLAMEDYHLKVTVSESEAGIRLIFWRLVSLPENILSLIINSMYRSQCGSFGVINIVCLATSALMIIMWGVDLFRDTVMMRWSQDMLDFRDSDAELGIECGQLFCALMPGASIFMITVALFYCEPIIPLIIAGSIIFTIMFPLVTICACRSSLAEG